MWPSSLFSDVVNTSCLLEVLKWCMYERNNHKLLQYRLLFSQKTAGRYAMLNNCPRNCSKLWLLSLTLEWYSEKIQVPSIFFFDSFFLTTTQAVVGQFPVSSTSLIKPICSKSEQEKGPPIQRLLYFPVYISAWKRYIQLQHPSILFALLESTRILFSTIGVNLYLTSKRFSNLIPCQNEW